MLTLKLAYRNILGAGLRTWLNVAALSFAYLAIIFVQGIYNGMNDQSERASIDALYGGGQYWQNTYDPYDPITLNDAHNVIPEALRPFVDSQLVAPILIRQATIYPGGRFRSVLLKGIEPSQKVLTIPSACLTRFDGTIPALIGSRMAKSTDLHKGDNLTIEWRDIHGTFDAAEVRIVDIMRTSVQEIDNNQIWIPLDKLQSMTALQGQATIIITGKKVARVQHLSGWQFKDLTFLLQDLHALIKSKTVSASILYFVLLFLAMIAIFDTQVLSIFRRRKEMGTLMALGMTRGNIIKLFTLEGAIHGIIAVCTSAIVGIPLLAYITKTGWEMPESVDSIGIAIGEKIFPTYSASLVLGTILLVLIVTTVVSFLPTRRIAKLKPTDALRGKLT
ncbi:MAG: FtsX-like permease family protein [Bacteroidota bacterium]|jgi:ABC-type lipoprotein release transport system permease subunit